MAYKDLATYDLATTVRDNDTLVMESGGSLKRMTMATMKQQLTGQLLYPTYTLEKTSSPTFDVAESLAVTQYIANMGGYMMLVKNGKVYAAKLNANNWNYFDDGTPVDNAAKYETMVHVPRCYFKGEGKTMTFGGLSPVPGGHSFDSPEWVGAYKMYVDGNNAGHSRPDVAPAHSKDMSAFWSCAQKTGAEFGLANYPFQCLVNAVFQTRYGNLNAQAVIGSGFQTNNWEAARDVPMGLTRTLGDGSGKVSYKDDTIGQQYPVKLFGFEDLWAKQWEFRPNIRFYMDDAKRYAVVYDGNRVSNTADGRKFECKLTTQEGSGTYAKSMELGEWWDMISQSMGGGDSVYYCDGFWYSTGGVLLSVGGRAIDGSLCGLSYANSYYGWSISWASIGARLAFYGRSVTIVNGTELVAM